MAKGAKPTREDRLKAALKANMARRKAQKRGREAEEATADSAPDEQKRNDNG
ncbi:hypothetical protein MWU52_07355 [Jannaschia sp. S6380]|uniref:hypothetical protein n=1 Tax=Jannaschia sp. S6380 TaxID=2926408 RepID=UPI001FF44A19|nr:hypothetical protein [Jannaschia sp. S6380]MCK0167362.1 hypothetical protein [Jannaschia sp. S6380]